MSAQVGLIGLTPNFIPLNFKTYPKFLSQKPWLQEHTPFWGGRGGGGVEILHQSTANASVRFFFLSIFAPSVII